MNVPGTAPMSNTGIYCGDLNKDVTEASLFRIFNAVGPVSSIRVCRDAVTRQSLGYAYINFSNSKDAERALDTMNYTKIGGKPCRLAWSNRDPSKRRSGKGNLYVKNLDSTIDNKTLYDTFSMFGNILSAKIVTDDKGKSAGYGFVHFSSGESAEKAIEKVNGMEIAGKNVVVARFIRKEDRETKERKDNYTNIYIKQFPKDWDDAKLTELCEVFGEITSVFVAKDEFATQFPTDESGVTKGFGFVNFKNHADAVKAEQGLNGRKLETGETLFAVKAQDKNSRKKELEKKFNQLKLQRFKMYRGRNLYVKNLSDSIDDDKLVELFKPFGAITSARLMRDGEQKTRGFGFVCYETGEMANAAITAMHSKMVEGKPLYVSHAQNKEERNERFQSSAKTSPTNRSPRKAFSRRGRGRGRGRGGRGRGGRGGMGRGAAAQAAQAAQGYNNYGGRAPPMSSVYQYGSYPGGPMMMGQTAPQMYQTQSGQYPRQMQQMNQPYNSSVLRSMGVPAQARVAQSAQQTSTPGAPVSNSDFARKLAGMSNQAAKQHIGEKLFQSIQKMNPNLAGKITGMLLEMDNTELLLLVEDVNALKAKVQEAVQVLNQHSQSQAAVE